MANLVQTQGQPLLIELDAQSWSTQLDNVESWLDNVLLTQASYRQLLEDTVDKIQEPHIQQYLRDTLERAKAHEAQAEALYAVIGRSPSRIRKKIGEWMGKGRQVLGELMALGGGVKGPWQDLHQLYLSNYDSMGAFAVVEQLGLALAIPRLAEIAFQIEAEKGTDQLVLKEYVLEMCSLSILYKQSF